jgi:hypothetical protein
LFVGGTDEDRTPDPLTAVKTLSISSPFCRRSAIFFFTATPAAELLATAILIMVTLFGALPIYREAQGGTYAAGVLVLIFSAAVAVTLAFWHEAQGACLLSRSINRNRLFRMNPSSKKECFQAFQISHLLVLAVGLSFLPIRCVFYIVPLIRRRGERVERCPCLKKRLYSTYPLLAGPDFSALIEASSQREW